MIYERQADGTWIIRKDIDLSSLAPKPPKPTRVHFSRRGMGLMAGLLLILALCLIWAWRERSHGAGAEALEMAQYASHPVGRIVPWFQLRIQRGEAGELRVAGQCNLPTGTQLEMRVFADDLLVALDYPVNVSGGQFETRPVLNKGRAFTPGAYRVRLRADFADRWQPPAVLQVVGNLGQRLQGPLVEKPEEATGATLTYVEDFALN